jgi:hypothetical protein
MRVNQATAAPASDILVEAVFEQLRLAFARHADEVYVRSAGRCSHADKSRECESIVVTQYEVIVFPVLECGPGQHHLHDSRNRWMAQANIRSGICIENGCQNCRFGRREGQLAEPPSVTTCRVCLVERIEQQSIAGIARARRMASPWSLQTSRSGWMILQQQVGAGSGHGS